MKVLITGASEGMGKEMAIILHEQGHDLFLVARNEEKLKKLKRQLCGKPHIIALDIASTTNCVQLYHQLGEENIDIVINNAGFGMHGAFLETDLQKELDMIELNIKSVHTLTKLFLQDFIKKKQGYILNIASTAAFSPGPLMATYFSTKSYVLHLTEAIYEELRRKKIPVYIGVFCPGPVQTKFHKKVGVSTSCKALPAREAAEYALHYMFQKKVVIIPTRQERWNAYFNRIIPIKILLKANYNVQNKKRG